MATLKTKRIVIAAVLVAVVAGTGFAQTRVLLTGDAVANFEQRPTASEVVDSFATANQPLYWGFGFEVVHRHLGFGGLYTVNFVRSSPSDWWLDWYGEAFYLSYHLFRHRTLIDPFLSLGLGSAGRVWLGPAPASTMAGAPLLLSVFPVVSAGLGVNLDGLYFGGKLSYLPVVAPPPVSPFDNVPLGRFLFTASFGLSLGG